MSTVDLLPNPVEAAAALHAPSERAQEIFYQTVIESRSQREIAREFQISQPRVNQIIAKVLAWVGDTLPGVAGEMTARQRFQAAKQITRDRLMYYPGLLVEKFHQSCEPVQVQITKPGCEPEFKIKQGQPKPQLLKAASDISAMLPRFELEMLVAESKMPVAIALSPTPPATLHPAPATRHPSSTTNDPPDRDLSAVEQSDAIATAGDDFRNDVTFNDEKTYEVDPAAFQQVLSRLEGSENALSPDQIHLRDRLRQLLAARRELVS